AGELRRREQPAPGAAGVGRRGAAVPARDAAAAPVAGGAGRVGGEVDPLGDDGAGAVLGAVDGVGGDRGRRVALARALAGLGLRLWLGLGFRPGFFEGRGDADEHRTEQETRAEELPPTAPLLARSGAELGDGGA